MAKAKKPRSEKQLANDKRLAEAAKAKKQAKLDEQEFVPSELRDKPEATVAAPPIPENPEVVPADPVVAPAPAPAQVDMNLVATIVAAMQAVQAQNPQVAQATPEEKLDETLRLNPNQARLGKNGVQGITFKYPIEKGYYPDPTARLLAEPKLARFAMPENYRFRWSVDGESYEKHGMTFSEPRFTLELFRLLYDDEGTATGNMALVARSIVHEDEMTTRVAAMRLNILHDYDDTDEGFRELMNEIRYWRIQQWLFGIFTPPKINTFRRAPKTQVIAGKVVEVYDTEELTDHETATSQASTLASQNGVGGISTPTL
jgi:hypothetical protein